MTYSDLHGMIMWPEAIISASGLATLAVNVNLALTLLVIGASLHTVLIIGLFVLPGGGPDGGEDD